MTVSSGALSDIRSLVCVGKYTGCDFQHMDTGSKQWSVDPLENNVDVPWETRMIPEISWSTSEDRPGQLYTLLFQDAGIGVTHSLWMNIEGNELSTATVNNGGASTRHSSPAQCHCIIIFRPVGFWMFFFLFCGLTSNQANSDRSFTIT